MPRPSIACQALADYRYRQAHTTQTDGCDNNSTGGPFDQVAELRGIFEGEFLALDIVPESWCRANAVVSLDLWALSGSSCSWRNWWVRSASVYVARCRHSHLASPCVSAALTAAPR